MSTIRLNTPKDLERFLRILAEESVTAAKADIQMPKPDEKARQKSFQSRIPKDKRALSEEDPPAEEATPAPPDAPAAAPVPEAPKKPVAPPASAEMNPTINAVIDAIKDIRGGRGASDSAVETELTAYFDRLEDAEKTSLVVMLRSLGGILRQQQMGTDAPEPTDYQIFTSMNAKEKSSSKPAPAATTTPSGEEEAEPSPTGPEDTSPPIKVGAPVTEAYRNRIRDLLARNR
jgi:hypothetical protein